ncbi:MAG: hypothetical protein ACI9SG_002803, partial [Maribacter sp.]
VNFDSDVLGDESLGPTANKNSTRRYFTHPG